MQTLGINAIVLKVLDKLFIFDEPKLISGVQKLKISYVLPVVD